MECQPQSLPVLKSGLLTKVLRLGMQILRAVVVTGGVTRPDYDRFAPDGFLVWFDLSIGEQINKIKKRLAASVLRRK